jgi:hypothetical protein
MDELVTPAPVGSAEDDAMERVQARLVRLAINGREVVASGSILLFEEEVLTIQPFRGTKSGPTVEVVFKTNRNAVPQTPRSELHRQGKNVRWTLINCNVPAGGFQYTNQLVVYRGKAIKGAIFYQLLAVKPGVHRVDFNLYYTSYVSPEHRPRRLAVTQS